jgi:hypothetical protein
MFERFDCYWKRTMAKKKLHRKMTPEEHARRLENHRLVQERIAEREALERELDTTRKRQK